MELVLATPLLLLLFVLVVQFALWAHAVHIAQAAANSGVQAARAYHSTAENGRRQATSMLDQLAGSLLTQRTVTSERTATTATVTVSGHVEDVVPGLHLPVTATVTAPLERVHGTP